MALAYTVEKEAFTSLDEGAQKLYVEKDGKYFLDLDLESVSAHVKGSDKDKIPLSRLNQEIEKRKASEAALKEIADGLIADIPEEKRAIIPKELGPGALIAWLRTAQKMNFFSENQVPPIDPKRPGDKPPANNDMNPVQRMATGYKSK